MHLIVKRLALAVTLVAVAGAVLAQSAKAPPNIVMIMVDDISPMDVSAIHRGLGAVKTPGIDRIANSSKSA